tara:strand:+ start:156 stop:296 length:141 start_codon:yes stop_codon:yes gene_type:complete
VVVQGEEYIRVHKNKVVLVALAVVEEVVEQLLQQLQLMVEQEIHLL